MANVKPVPEGMHTVTPQLIVDGAEEALNFYVKAFGAEVLAKAPDPSGKKIWHASMRIGDSTVYVNDANAEMDAAAQPTRLWLYLPDVDAAFKQATEAGAEVKMEPADMFWGDRIAAVVDAWGNRWNLATRIKDLTPEEMKQASDDFIASLPKQGG